MNRVLSIPPSRQRRAVHGGLPAWGALRGLGAVLGLGALLALAALPVAASTLAVAPLSDRQGDPVAAEAADRGLREVLADGHDMVDPAALRTVLRRGRIRVLDDALPAEMRQIARETGAERVLSFTLHQTARRHTPTLALSGRAYDGTTGELLWAGFEAASGLDGRTVLGLGVVDDMAVLAERTARRLALDFLAQAPPAAGHSAAGSLVGPVAVLPFGSVTDAAGTNAAETVTEVTRTALFREGVAQATPGRVAEVLRRHRWNGWGGIDDATRRALVDEAGVRWIVTGGVERYDVAGTAEEPEPRVAVALRLVDAATGKIVWMGGRERAGWDGQGPFRTGRVYSRGDLAWRLVAPMVRSLLRDRSGEMQANARTSP